jgi:SAM-dependent methyltransferase
MQNTLAKHREIWNKKPVLREIYFDWYRMLAQNLVEGKTVELGSGTGNFKEFMPQSVSSDIDPQPWLDKVFDAHKMPFRAGTISNLVMIDVFHHLADPVKFLHEAHRVLRKGGRILMIEPYPSFFSIIIYKIFHPEPFFFNIDYFSAPKMKMIKKPWDSNQAIPYLIFFKNVKLFNKQFSKKYIFRRKELFSFFTYPLSGGFDNKQLYPFFLKPFLSKAEELFKPFSKWLAFRCLVVLEKL